ncbi:hypothetical protein G6F62_004863 [Rhizopus arrhizus]|nr:hypothetical protein G6F21_002959 [Rhizopus arrhizus]KAG0811706.1 hypothetical protein G6F20_006951 [Rhizopus arrhizus]KAG0832430.1 hypothetical protein G6F18_007220 [Rhizopus arrhizus]KAG0834793.1 hypothetical protein G6F19_005030 [Rhizopus arrhizus]KAG0856926.1 hypothetical protein G6F17_004140 [Rhizopus arrhizus]
MTVQNSSGAEELRERLWDQGLAACLNMIHIVCNLCLNGEMPEWVFSVMRLEEEEDLKRMKNDEFYLEPCNF